jgi:tetratricopeptide (TPR) repeat protein
MAFARVLVSLFVVLSASAGLGADVPSIAPRPVSQGERAAVGFLVRYLEGDRDAVWTSIDPASQLHALGRDDAMREIEARLGPALGSEWELRTVVPSLADRVAVFGVGFPSGLDDTVTIDVSPVTWKITRISVLAEPSPFADPEIGTKTVVSADVESGGKDSQRTIFIIGLVGLAVAIAMPLIRLGSRGLAAIALLIAASIISGVVAWRVLSLSSGQKAAAPAGAKAAVSLRLGQLAPMRQMMATSNSGDVATAFQRLPTGDVREVAQLWRAQADLNAMRFRETETTLGRFERPTAIPLVELLRARLALARSQEADAAVAYERAMALGPGHDGIWSEAANAFWTGGYTDMARAYLDRMVRIGSRDATVYYVLAQLSVVDDERDRASECFRAGWQLAPVERTAVLSDPMLWTVLHRPELYPLLSLNSARQAQVPARGVGTTPLLLSPAIEASTSGDQLLLHIGEASVRIPFGSSLGPAGTPAVSAETWERAEELRAASDLNSLMQGAASAAALTQPVLRRRIEAAATHLARRNDWAGVAKITESFAVTNQNVPTDLLMLRAMALRRLRRDDDARTLLTALADSPAVKRRSDPQTLMSLAEMVASLDQFDAAIKLYERADANDTLGFIDDRIRQISTQRRLQNGYRTHGTDHFDIRYPDETIPWRAEKVGMILEAELKRLRKWIPLDEVRKTEVQLLPWQEFQATFAMTENMSGLFDGRIRVPLADIPYLPAEAVAILSHELAHAMIAQSTEDRAPHWFQEGLAQRIEMLPYRANSGVIYEDARFLSTASVDGVLRGYPDAQLIEQAYVESHSIVQYIDARFGTKAIHTMLKAYRDGADTEEAILRACGRPLEDFDRDFLGWSRTEAPPIWTATVISYDGEAKPAMKMSNPEAATPAETKERKKPAIPESLRKRAFSYKEKEKHP